MRPGRFKKNSFENIYKNIFKILIKLEKIKITISKNQRFK